MQNGIDLIENKCRRFPVVLLVDTSSSMLKSDNSNENYTKIERVNEALVDLKRTLTKDNVIADGIDIAVVSFDSDIKVVQDFVNIQDFNPPKLVAADGMCRLCGAVLKAISMLEERKQKYKHYCIQYRHPLILAFIGGEYTDYDDEEEVKYAIKKGKEDKKFVFKAVVLQDDESNDDDGAMGAINNWDPKDPNKPDYHFAIAFNKKTSEITKSLRHMCMGPFISYPSISLPNYEDQEKIIDSIIDELNSDDNAEGDNDVR